MGREEGQLRAGGLERLEGEIAFFFTRKFIIKMIRNDTL